MENKDRKKLLSKEELTQLFIDSLKSPEGQEAIMKAISDKAPRIRRILK